MEYTVGGRLRASGHFQDYPISVVIEIFWCLARANQVELRLYIASGFTVLDSGGADLHANGIIELDSVLDLSCPGFPEFQISPWVALTGTTKDEIITQLGLPAGLYARGFAAYNPLSQEAIFEVDLGLAFELPFDLNSVFQRIGFNVSSKGRVIAFARATTWL